MILKKIILLCFTFITVISSALALEVPTLTGPVVDKAQVLSPQVIATIENALYDLNQRDNIQFQVLIIPTLGDNETMEGYSIKVVDQWKLGKTRDDKGALLLIAINDRKMRIEVGRGLEGDLTDLTSKRIITEMQPHFRKNDYANGVALGLALMAKSAGSELRFGNIKPRHERKKASPLSIIFLIIVFIVISRNGGGPFILGSILSGGGGYRGGGYRGGGGGWSGGGGGFGGGGASGDW